MDVLSREDYQQAIIDYIEYYNNKLIKVKKTKDLAPVQYRTKSFA
jgi:hypothetical protein